jgi:mono/diheme cytochrome c family protein
MRFLLPVILLLSMAPFAPADEPDAEKIALGKRFYAENHCKLCHSIAGVGNPKGPHDGVGSLLTPAEIRQWLMDPQKMAAKAKAGRKPPMISFSALPSEEIDALVAYVSSLKKTQPR